MSGRDAYFLKLQSALHAAAIASPVLVIDLARLNANIDTLLADLPEGMAYRIVAKSLPSPSPLRGEARSRSLHSRVAALSLHCSVLRARSRYPLLTHFPVSLCSVSQFHSTHLQISSS